jgi:hypothetical protein
MFRAAINLPVPEDVALEIACIEAATIFTAVSSLILPTSVIGRVSKPASAA